MSKAACAKKCAPYAVVFLIPVAVYFLTAVFCNMAPFGPNSPTMSDGYSQMSYFLKYFFDAINGGTFPVFTYNGFGMDFWEVITYYISSPLTPITYVFYNLFDIMTAVEITTAIRGGLMAVSMFWFLRKTFIYPGVKSHFSVQQQTILAAGFAWMYVFSAFNAAYMHIWIWGDTLFLLPVCVYLLAKGIKTGKWAGYAASIGLLIMCNFYMAYTVCIFLLIYAIYRIYRTPGKKYAIKRFVQFAGSSIIGALMAGAFLVPAYYLATLHSTSEPIKIQFLFLSPYTVGQGLYSFLWENLPACLNNTGVYWFSFPVFASVLFIPLSIFVLQKQAKTKKDKKDKLHFVGLLVLVLASIFLFGISFVLQGFALPTGLPNRYLYIYVFFLISLAFKIMLRVRPSRFELLASFAISIAFVVVSYINNAADFFLSTPPVSWAFLLIYFLALWLLYGYGPKLSIKTVKQTDPKTGTKIVTDFIPALPRLSRSRLGYKPKTFFVLIFVILLLGETSSRFALITQSKNLESKEALDGEIPSYNEWQSSLQKYGNLGKLMQDTAKKEKDETNPFSSYSISDSLFTNAGLTSTSSFAVFSSTIRSKTTAGLAAFSGIYSPETASTNSYYVYNPTTALSLFYGTKYYAFNTNFDTPAACSTTGHEVILHNKDTLLLRSKESSEFGYFIKTPSAISGLQKFGGEGIDRANKYLNAACGVSLYDKQFDLKASSGNYGVFLRNYTFEIPANEYGVVSFNNISANNVYDPNSVDTLLVNGIPVNFPALAGHVAFLDFGIAEKNRSVVITVPFYVKDMSYWSASEHKVSAIANYLCEQSAQNAIYKDRSFSFDINNETQCVSTYFLPVAYDKGWTCKVNGAKTELIDINGFTGFEVPSGNSHIEMTFWPQGLPLGILLSLFGMFATLVLLNREKRARAG